MAKNTDEDLECVGMNRRAFLGQTATIGVAATTMAWAAVAPSRAQDASALVPASGNDNPVVLIRGGQVLTMDEGVPDLETGDVLVRNGKIAEVGANIQAPEGARVVDASNSIVMPGFVDTHSHLWEGILRGAIRHDDPIRGYFPTYNRLWSAFTPEDRRISTKFEAVQALLSGVTTIGDYAHNVTSPEDARAEIAGVSEAGARHLYFYGPPAGYDNLPHRLDRDGVLRIKEESVGNPLLKIGVNLQPTASEAGLLLQTADDPDFVSEMRFSRENGFPISMHYGSRYKGQVGFMDRHGLLGSDIVLVHPQGFTQEERDILVRNGVTFAMSPIIETNYSRIRNGYTQYDELDQLGATLGISIDSACATANYDFFTVIKAALWQHRSRADVDRMRLTPKRLIELATINGARVLGMDSEVGSLTPGKAADVIVVRKGDINMVPVIDPYFALVYSGMPQNISMTMVGGKVLVENGRHTTLDMDEVARAADAAGRVMHEKSEAIIAKEEGPQAHPLDKPAARG